MGQFSGVKRVLLRPLILVGLNQLSMLWKFHGTVKDQERKEERNGITEEINRNNEYKIVFNENI